MKLNMGTIDRGGRILIAAIIAYLALGAGALTGLLFWIGLAVAVVFVLTAIVGNCPLYSILGLKTCQDC